MNASKASRQANTAHEQIVTEALDIVKMACHHDISLTVLSWERQALHLALRRSYNRTDISYRGTLNDDTYYRVRSDSQPAGHYYVVTVHPIAHPTCTCMAGSNGRPCKHAGIALGLWAEERDRARLAAEASGWDDEMGYMSRAEYRDYCEAMAAHYDAQERAKGR